MRIVAGKWRGRFLPVDDSSELRPTPERIRETLFNWLAPVIDGAHCLDLFAGTGVLGLEALSRGAASATLVERSPKLAATLSRSIESLGATTATLHVCDAFRWLEVTPQHPCDIVFLDPPYALESLGDLCRLLDENSWVAPGGSIYMERDLRDQPPLLPNGWEPIREKTAGKVRYSLVRARHNKEV